MKPGFNITLQTMDAQKFATKECKNGYDNCVSGFSWNYLEKGKTVNGEYYANLFQQLSNKIKEKRPYLVKKVLFHQ